jgi:O-antigen ligase
MKALIRYMIPALAAVLLALLVYFLAGPEVAERRFALIALAVAAAVWFFRQNTPLAILVIVPIGPVLDMFFLTSGRGIYATEVILSAALVVWSAGVARRGLARPGPALPTQLLGGYTLLGIVALLLGAFALFDELRMLRQLLLASMTALMIGDLMSGSSDRAALLRLWMGAVLAGLFLLSIGGLAEFLTRRSEPGSFYRGSVGLAVHIAIFSPLALGLALSTWSRIWRLAALFSWLAAMLCLPLTASRGAIASVLLTSLALVSLTAWRHPRMRWRLLLPVVLAVLVGVGLFLKPDLAGETFAYKLEASLRGDFFSTRTTDWQQALTGIKAAPLSGSGPDASSGSIPLELAQRNGLPAAIMLLAAVVLAAVGVFRSAAGTRSEDPLPGWGLALGLVGFLLVGLAETGLGARTMPLLVLLLSMSAWTADFNQS